MKTITFILIGIILLSLFAGLFTQVNVEKFKENTENPENLFCISNNLNLIEQEKSINFICDGKR